MTPAAAPGWYPAQGDPEDTVRYWDGSAWIGGPVTAPTYQDGFANMPWYAHGALAGGWRRVFALVIDWIIVTIGTEVIDALSPEVPGLPGLDSLLLTSAYFVVPVGLWGRTAGKGMLGIQVVGADGSAPPGWAWAVLRVAPWMLIGLAGVVPIDNEVLRAGQRLLRGAAWTILAVSGLVLVFADGQRRAPWDYLARTRVVEDGRDPPPSRTVWRGTY